MDYLISNEDDEIHSMMELIGDMMYIDILVTGTLIMCGDGMIAFECAILVPSYENDSDSDFDEMDHEYGMSDGAPRAMTMAGRRICIFSVSMEAIVRMEDADPKGLTDTTSIVMLDSYREARRRRVPTNVALLSQESTEMLSMEIQSDGNVMKKQSFETALCKEDLGLEGYESHSSSRRPMLVTPLHIIVADNLSLARNNPNRNQPETRAVISFLPNPQNRKREKEDCVTSVILEGERNVIRLVSVRDEHIVAFCDKAEYENEYGGGITLLSHQRRSLIVVIIHVPSRTIIQEVRFGDASVDFGLDTLNAIRQSPIFFSIRGNSVAVGVSCLGIILTGSDVRALTDSAQKSIQESVSEKGGLSEKKKKKKKNQKNISKGKKDGFARGMSLRG
mmetsp:Transcript_14286/g.20916  ORF Transcript_14286/g.20916 Transcript_14286/m.20916 type:complete len:392 (+) Transcript_14286:40-1215(+)